jgi:hypothetical protein
MEIQIEFARLAYGEQIIRCTNLPPEEVECFLSLDGEEEKAKKWMALAKAKQEGNPTNVSGLLIYLFSNMGKLNKRKQLNLIRRIKKRGVRLNKLTSEELKGTHLKWEHVFELVGKEFNPTREKEKVRRIYEEM